MTDPLRDIAARPQRYENVDGTTEMSFGLMIFAMTLMGYLTPIAEKNAILPRGFAGYLLIFVGTLLPFILLGTVLTRTIKRHITYPRTGYVAYRRITGENRWRTVFFAIVLLSFLLRLQSWPLWCHSFNETTTQAWSAP